MRKYSDRVQAGLQLAHLLQEYANDPETIVLALPRGGVPVAYEIARTLNLPLDVFIVRKLGVPGHMELAMGAIASGGMHVFNQSVIDDLHVSPEEMQRVIEKETLELKRREEVYRIRPNFPTIRGKKIILVDDGIATGATMRTAIKALQQLHPHQIIVAVPVADEEIVKQIVPLVDKLICPLQPDNLFAVGAWYEDFNQTEDEEVHAKLRKSLQFHPGTNDAAEIKIATKDAQLDGLLTIPSHPKGLIIFAHGSGSSRLSPRNQYIAKQLQKENFATLLFDLLTQDEDEIDAQTSQYRFDIDFLAQRLLAATEVMSREVCVDKLKIAYFGASTGGAAALVAAAELGDRVRAVVSRGGRPDLAGSALANVQAPTLLIVGGEDERVIELNEQAYEQMQCVKRIEIVAGATHLFEEEGALEEVGRLAREWFVEYI